MIIPELPYKAESFAAMGLERDIELPAEVAYAHRTADDMEIYFIANQKMKPGILQLRSVRKDWPPNYTMQ